MIHDVLHKIGLTEKEAAVYLALVKHGNQPASVIARATSLPRNTARFHMDELARKGLVSKKFKGNMQLYSAEPPETLFHLLEIKKEKFLEEVESQTHQLKKLLPELTSLRAQTDTFPKVKFFEGVENLKLLYEDTLTSKTPIACYSSVDDLLDVFTPEYMEWYATEKAQRNIFLRSIALDTPRTRQYVKDNKKKKRNMCLVPAEKYPFTNEINVYDGKISIIALKDLVGVLLESKDMYIAQTTIFELAWGFASQFEKNYQ